jgi:hypothetical protein
MIWHMQGMCLYDGDTHLISVQNERFDGLISIDLSPHSPLPTAQADVPPIGFRYGLGPGSALQPRSHQGLVSGDRDRRSHAGYSV